MLYEIIYVLVCSAMVIACFEFIAADGLKDILSDPSIKLTTTYRESLDSFLTIRGVFYVIIIGINLTVAFVPLKEIEGNGLINYEENKTRKQTYLEYVKERLEVERMMK